ncbi:SRPBCC family protein [Leifsonia shinshuensis]
MTDAGATVERPQQRKAEPMSTTSPPDLAIEFVLARDPSSVFDAIVHPREWWMADIDGSADAVGAEFSYEVPGVHAATMRVTELVHGRRVVWRVVKSRMTFVDDPEEWVGTDLAFELRPDATGTRIRFTHVGLTAEDECYDVCSRAWRHYLSESLHGLLTTGRGAPSSNPDERRRHS